MPHRPNPPPSRNVRKKDNLAYRQPTPPGEFFIVPSRGGVISTAPAERRATQRPAGRAVPTPPACTREYAHAHAARPAPRPPPPTGLGTIRAPRPARPDVRDADRHPGRPRRGPRPAPAVRAA